MTIDINGDYLGGGMPRLSGEAHRDALIERFHARYARSDARKHWLHNQIMPDYDSMQTRELEALANGVRWLTFDPFDVRGCEPEDEEWGVMDYSDRPVTEGGVMEPDFAHMTLEYVTDLAMFLGLEPVESSTGVLCWGDFS